MHDLRVGLHTKSAFAQNIRSGLSQDHGQQKCIIRSNIPLEARYYNHFNGSNSVPGIVVARRDFTRHSLFVRI